MLTVGTFGFYALAYLLPGLTEIPLWRRSWPSSCSRCRSSVVSRAVARAICRHTDAYRQNTLIIGAGFVGQRVALKLLHHPEYGVNVVGFVDEPATRARRASSAT